MKVTILYGPRDGRFEERDEPKIIEPDPNSKDKNNRHEWIGGRK